MDYHIENDNFAEDSVIVVLDTKLSKINKVYTTDFFGGLSIKAIEDLTERKFNFESKNGEFKQIFKITLSEPSKKNVLRAINVLNKLPGVFSAEPNYFYKVSMSSNDPLYIQDRLWGLNGDNGIDVNLAWNVTTGSKNVRVGILDTGIANHDDLNENLTEGYDFYLNNSITNDDFQSHGTHVAGTIGAVGNNNLGLTGINWNVSLVPLQVVNEHGLISVNAAVEAIEWAEDRWGTNAQIDIINYSVDGFGESVAVREAVRNYHGLFVWAAGNSTEDIDTKVSTWGTFNLDNIISVGAINKDGTRCNFSNYSTNNTNVHIYAPGADIISTASTEVFSTGYASMSGTSMAAPHVTGVAALLLSIKPTLTAAQLKNTILDAAEDITISIPTSSGAENQVVKKLNARWAVTGGGTPYKLTLKSEGNVTLSREITVRYGKPLPEVDFGAPQKTGYAFDGYYSADNKLYYKMDLQDDEQIAQSNGLDVAMIEKLVPAEGLIWDIHQDLVIYGRWESVPFECDYSYWCMFEYDIIGNGNVHLTHGPSKITPPNISGYTFNHFVYAGNNYTEKDNIPITLYRGYSGEIYLQDWITAYYDKNECVVEGTLITLADGTKKPVEMLQGNEMLLVWNLFTGQFDVAPILFIDSDPLQQYQVINLNFSDNTTVKVVSEHAFWDITLNQYVYLRKDAAQYIGHHFNKQTTDSLGKLIWTDVELVSVTITQECTTVYSPITYGHFCYYVNGMLSMPGGISGLFNIFDVDADTMMINEESMVQDIEEYGLFTYEEFAELLSITEEVFNAFNGQYLKVAIGKGLIDMETLSNLVQRYAVFFEQIQ